MNASHKQMVIYFITCQILDNSRFFFIYYFIYSWCFRNIKQRPGLKESFSIRTLGTVYGGSAGNKTNAARMAMYLYFNTLRKRLRNTWQGFGKWYFVQFFPKSNQSFHIWFDFMSFESKIISPQKAYEVSYIERKT